MAVCWRERAYQRLGMSSSKGPRAGLNERRCPQKRLASRRLLSSALGSRYNRYVRWAARCLGRPVPRSRAIRRTGGGSSHRLLGGEGAPLGQRPHDKDPRPDRRGLPADRLYAHRWKRRRLRRRSAIAGEASAKVTTATPSAGRSSRAARCRIFRRRPTTRGRIASPFLHSNRNAIERMFCRLKDFRRVATRYDQNAANFLAAVCNAATVAYWL
jgi:transposase